MKKILSVVLALALCASCFMMTACSGTSDSGKLKIGIVQLVEHPALDAATEGFQQALIDVLGEDKVVVDVQVAAGDTASCAQFCAGTGADGELSEQYPSAGDSESALCPGQ